ncbi:hypothetical protein ACOMHN_026653 [Nucella lapillus]
MKPDVRHQFCSLDIRKEEKVSMKSDCISADFSSGFANSCTTAVKAKHGETEGLSDASKITVEPAASSVEVNSRHIPGSRCTCEAVATDAKRGVIKTELGTDIVNEVTKTEPVTAGISSDVINLKTEKVTADISIDVIKIEGVTAEIGGSVVIKTEPVTADVGNDVIKSDVTSKRQVRASISTHSSNARNDDVTASISSDVISDDDVTATITSDVIRNDPVTTDARTPEPISSGKKDEDMETGA